MPTTNTNRLIHETSPYLLQHAHNPVDWYPWGEEALSRAKSENRPIFLSIGYSACHWCHVMERESFENEEIAALLNEKFVAIKVDREERPDIDSIYMQAVQMMTGHGGWPMSMFLTPEGVPFYGGTYFPPDDSRGMPGFRRVLKHVSDAWRHQKDQVDAAGREIRAALARSVLPPSDGQPLSREELDRMSLAIASGYDAAHGGFGGAPKFPPSMMLEFLLEVVSRGGPEQLAPMIEETLRKMARGGIYDQIGGGFHRYSVDERWLVPHFEKMLYDNALLARIYLHAWQWSGDDLFRRIARETLDFVEREMTSEEGGFFSTLDADSEGEEGRFYVWSRDEVMEALGEEEGLIFCTLYDATERGNWEGANILNIPRDPQVVADDFGISMERLSEIAAHGKCRLYGKRSERVRPGRDEKILAGWNGWMLGAFAEAALAFNEPRYRQIASRSAAFLVERMQVDRKLRRSYKDGAARIPGLLEDHAGVAWGLIRAFEATQEMRWLVHARSLAEDIIDRFPDRTDGGFFDTPDDHERLITRPKDPFDNATPAGNSVAIDVLQKLALYFAEPSFERAAREGLRALFPLARRYPSGFGFLLCDAEWDVSRPLEIALTGEPESAAFQELLTAIGEAWIPHRILVWKPAELPVMEGRDADRTAVWICEQYTCREPITDVKALREALRSR